MIYRWSIFFDLEFGINAEGLPTIDVCGHEVPIAAYWRVVSLHEGGKSTAQIVNQILIGTESKPIDQKSMAIIVDAILDNLQLIDASTSDLSTSASASGIISHKKPKQISVYRASRFASEADLSDALARLKSAQKEEDKVLNQTLRVAAQLESVSRAMADGWEKRKTEAALDVEVRKYLRKHKALEAEVDYAKKVVQLNRASLR